MFMNNKRERSRHAYYTPNIQLNLVPPLTDYSRKDEMCHKIDSIHQTGSKI